MEQKVNNTKNITIVIIAVLLLIICALLIIFISSSMNKDNQADLAIATDTIKYSTDIMQLGAEDTGDIKIPGYDTITIPANTKDVKITLPNPEGNKCYFKFELIVNNESIYTSKLVQPGQAIAQLELTKKLDRGEYDLIIKVSPYSLEDKASLIGAEVKANLNVV